MSAIFPAAVEQTVARKELVAYIKVDDTWVPIGWHCTDSSMNVEIDTDTQKDILGNVFTNVSTPELSQEFDPLPIRQNPQNVGVDKLQQLLHDQWMNQNFSGSYDTLIVYLYAGDANANPTKYDAHRFPASQIVPGDFGGSADEPLNRPITVHFGGAMEQGKATIVDGVVAYTKNNNALEQLEQSERKIKTN